MDFHLVTLHVERDIRQVQKIVREIFLDDITLLAAAHHKFVDAMRRIALHDVPKDRLSTDLHHRLGTSRCFLADIAQYPNGNIGLFKQITSIKTDY
jgi:hypothetical protein